MNNKKDSLTLTALLGMDLCWLYGWAALVMIGGFHRPFPIVLPLCTLALSVLLTLSHNRGGWRIYQIAGAHLLGLMLISAGVLYGLDQPPYAFYNGAWVTESMAISRSPRQWLLLVVSLVWEIIFWISGTRLAMLPRNPMTVSNHFDFGVIALVLLFLIEMLLAVEGGITLNGLSLPHILFAFFAFSVPAFCLARYNGQGATNFITGFRAMGVVLAFLSLVLLLGSAVTALFSPYLTIIAENGVALFKTITAPGGAILLRLLSFLFGHGKILSEPVNPGSSQTLQTQTIAGQQAEGWLLLLQKALMYLTAGLGVLLALTLSGLLIWQLGWWLSQTTKNVEPGPSPWHLMWQLIRKIIAVLARYCKKLPDHGRPTDDPIRLYLALVKWGKVSGLSFVSSETPREYGQRLADRLPKVTEEISIIIAVHNIAIYGQQPRQSAQLDSARLAYRRLCSPRFWLMRLKSLLSR